MGISEALKFPIHLLPKKHFYYMDYKSDLALTKNQIYQIFLYVREVQPLRTCT